MKRSTYHLIVDVFLALGAVGLILTGLLIEFVLPGGSRQASVWGMTRHEWGEVHFWIAMGILGAAGLHLLLNWGWVCSVIARIMRVQSAKPTVRRQLWTAVTTALLLAVLVGGFLYAADSAKVADDGGGYGQGPGTRALERQLDDLFLIEP